MCFVGTLPLARRRKRGLVWHMNLHGQSIIAGIPTPEPGDSFQAINPATGEAAIQNESPFFDVSIDAYTIASADGALLTGNGAWNIDPDGNVLLLHAHVISPGGCRPRRR